QVLVECDRNTFVVVNGDRYIGSLRRRISPACSRAVGDYSRNGDDPGDDVLVIGGSLIAKIRGETDQWREYGFQEFKLSLLYQCPGNGAEVGIGDISGFNGVIHNI